MNNRTIWLIGGFMSVALIGSIILQFYWVKKSVDLKRNEFDENVIEALVNVSNKLTEDEEAEYNNGLFSPTSSTGSNIDIFQGSTFTNGLKKEPTKVDLIEFQSVSRILNEKPLDTRLGDTKELHNFLKEELKERNINTSYNYGIYSNKSKGFILMGSSEREARMQFHDEHMQQVQPHDRDLADSKFKVSLFRETNGDSPGKLRLYFPDLTSVVWQSAWKFLLASIFFTSVILLSFLYSLQIIFRQKKVSEMKTDFINNMTHEFKTPIATISLAADSITSPMILGNPDKVNRFANIIKQENKRMLGQVEKVLQMAQLDKENFKLTIVELNMHELINQAVLHANLQVAKKEGIVTVDLNAKKATVEGDLTHVSNIIHNFLDNANKYTPGKPEISVSTRNVSNGVEVIIKDNGIGMSKEALKHIFQKFFRVHTGNIHDVKGFGLGLSYVKVMMTAHNGTIDVKSELGKGSSFVLHFPFYHQV